MILLSLGYILNEDMWKLRGKYSFITALQVNDYAYAIEYWRLIQFIFEFDLSKFDVFFHNRSSGNMLLQVFLNTH